MFSGKADCPQSCWQKKYWQFWQKEGWNWFPWENLKKQKRTLTFPPYISYQPQYNVEVKTVVSPMLLWDCRTFWCTLQLFQDLQDHAIVIVLSFDLMFIPSVSFWGLEALWMGDVLRWLEPSHKTPAEQSYPMERKKAFPQHLKERKICLSWGIFFNLLENHVNCGKYRWCLEGEVQAASSGHG